MGKIAVPKLAARKKEQDEAMEEEQKFSLYGGRAGRHEEVEEEDEREIHLRAYQEEAVRYIFDYFSAHPRGRLLVVVPPGGGKTVIAAAVLSRFVEQEKRVLVMAHRREIVGQHYDHLLWRGVPRAQLGVLMGGDSRANPRARIQIASDATLHARRARATGMFEAEVVLTDESHRDASDGRRRLRALYPEAFQFGLTATPHRLDTRGLREDFDEMHVVSSISELIADDHLSAPKVFTVPRELLPDLTTVRVLAGEYESVSLERAVNQKALVGGIVSHWKRLAARRRTVCFAASIAHSKHIVMNFMSVGVPAEHLDQDTPIVERDAVLARLASGETKVVSCVNILAEGWDCPPCKCVIQARPTKSLNMHVQQAGRCMRPWRSPVDNSHLVSPLILDHAGNMVRHGLPQMERTWSLDEEGPNADKGEPPAKVCAACEAVMHAGVSTCGECGAEFPEPELPSMLEEKPGVLKIYELRQKERADELVRIRDFAQRKGLTEEWVERVYAAKFNTKVEKS